MSQPPSAGVLFLVATPIGNLADITHRAVRTLREADLILAEDTRRAKALLTHLQIDARVQSYHQHNEAARLPGLLRRLADGKQIALISDAGTPLISDPGERLVQSAMLAGVRVSPVPGACAVVAAVSASGHSASRFCFDGFLPPKRAARRSRLQVLKSETRTLVVYESAHRIVASLTDIDEIFGGRRLTLAREISKKFETFYAGTAAEVLAVLTSDAVHCKGEFVLVVEGASPAAVDNARAEEVMRLLLPEMPLKRASQIAARIVGGTAKEMYAAGLRLTPP